MEINTLGAVLKYYREKYEIMQGDLCDGICTSSMLSKVELGNKVVDSLMAESLLGRVGKTVLQFELLLNDEDYELWKLREEIKKAEQDELYILVEHLLEDYYTMMPFKSVHQQFYLYHSALCKLYNGESSENVCQMLYEALLLTKQKMGETYICLCNPIEIEIILLLYHHHFCKWEKRDIENELLNILEQVQKIYSGRLKQEVEIRIFLELIAYEQQMGDYSRTIKYIDQTIEFLSQGRSLEYIAELHFLKAQMIEKLYNQSGKWEIEENACKRECLMAYHVFNIMGQEEKSIEVERYCEEKLGWQITK